MAESVLLLGARTESSDSKKSLHIQRPPKLKSGALISDHKPATQSESARANKNVAFVTVSGLMRAPRSSGAYVLRQLCRADAVEVFEANACFLRHIGEFHLRIV